MGCPKEYSTKVCTAYHLHTSPVFRKIFLFCLEVLQSIILRAAFGKHYLAYFYSKGWFCCLIQGGMGSALLSDPDKIEAVGIYLLSFYRYTTTCCRSLLSSVWLEWISTCENDMCYLCCSVQILTTLVKGISKPVTCKIRILPTVSVYGSYSLVVPK